MVNYPALGHSNMKVMGMCLRKNKNRIKKMALGVMKKQLRLFVYELGKTRGHLVYMWSNLLESLPLRVKCAKLLKLKGILVLTDLL